jgi:hypothetical protein
MITTGNGPTRSTEQTSIAFALQSAQGMDKFVRTWASPVRQCGGRRDEPPEKRKWSVIFRRDWMVPSTQRAIEERGRDPH